ncbi:MAG: DUF4159 domain-containing protein, partial [Candidatus Latescibacterota bacterium]
LLHVGLIGVNPFKRPPEEAARPVATRFLKREPNLTKPLELRKLPQPTRQMEQRQVQLSQARMDQVQATAAFSTRATVARAAAPRVAVVPQVAVQAANLEPALAAAAVTGARQPENKIDMALEMLDVNSMDTGRYRAMVVQDPSDRQAVKGFINMAMVISARSVAAGTIGYTSVGVRDVDAIVDAVNEYTGLKARFIGQITYDDNRLMEVPVIYPVGAPNESEMENLARYLLAGGFVYGWLDFSQILEKYGGLVNGQDFWAERLTDDHPLFSSFFNIKGGGGLSGLNEASLANQKSGLYNWQSIQGFFLRGRLAGISFSHGTGLLNADYNQDATRQMQMAVNVVVYALTQEGSITQHLMNMVR